jgi:hypothetical protein
MTIIGFEKSTDGTRNILVFDPMFHDSNEITRRIGHNFTTQKAGEILRAYRRGGKYLRRYKEFEVLKYVHSPPQLPNAHSL